MAPPAFACLVLLAGLLPVLSAANYTDSYDPDLALRALWFASAAYCESTVMDWACTACRNVPGVIPIKAFRGLHETFGVASVDTEQKRFVIAFKGSTDIPNWITDLDAWREPFPPISGAEVHSGFLSAWLSVRSGVLETLSSMREQYGDYPVLATGHSLGAALAFWAGYEIQNATLYNFGQPRMGNLAFAKGAVENFTGGPWRVTHWLDIVPHLPMKIEGFHQSSTEVWYNFPSTSYKVCDSSGEDPTCSDSRDELSVYDHLVYLGHRIPNLECA